MRISNRLKEIASLVDDNTSIIDIGCDHALLDIFLVQNKKLNKIVASDNKKEPLNSALSNIKRYHVENKIKLSLNDGLKNVDDDIDTVIISGMGGELIKDILKVEYLKNINTLILSPQSDIYALRTHLNKIGYKFIFEKIIKDQKKYYIIMKLERGKEKLSEEELKYGPVLLKNKDDIFREYYDSILKEKINILDKVPINLKNAVMDEIDELNELLDNFT
ncbi:MAG: SAM-dependent methyltransferase [Bacilli bacterium]|nr:SAM-dependent methyltransferase [Bacilli bacterium]